MTATALAVVLIVIFTRAAVPALIIGLVVAAYLALLWGGIR
ncbi:MAG TPA: hypothetical protein VFN75_09775 [Pseudonocardiaceae bacterium]|nr:hypothetical protein [Pseudonocardiaceae bacterium]